MSIAGQFRAIGAVPGHLKDPPPVAEVLKQGLHIAPRVRRIPVSFRVVPTAINVGRDSGGVRYWL